jgi:hypothetical protein
MPESQRPLGAPGVPDVLLWPLELQVHFTVSPWWIVTASGEKMKPPSPTVTVTVAPLAAAGQSAARTKAIHMIRSSEHFFPFSIRFAGKVRASFRPEFINCSLCELESAMALSSVAR